IAGWILPKQRCDEIWIEIKGSSFSRCGIGGHQQKLRLVIDPTRRPKEFTLEFTHPVTARTSQSKGIYQLAGDTPTACSDNTGKTRPSQFESSENGEGFVLSFLKRKKP